MNLSMPMCREDQMEKLILYLCKLLSCFVIISILDRFMEGRYKRSTENKYVYPAVKIVQSFGIAAVNMLGVALLNFTVWVVVVAFEACFLYYEETDKPIRRISECEILLFSLVAAEGFGFVLTDCMAKILHIGSYPAMMRSCMETALSNVMIIFIFYAFADRLIRDKNVPFSKMQCVAVCVMLAYSFVNMAVVVKMSKGAVDYLVVFDLMCLVLVDLFLLYAMKVMNEKEYLEYEISALEQQAKMQYEYYLRQEQRYHATVRVLHDVDKHTRAMEQLYSAGNTQTAMEYGGQISGMLKPLIPVRYTGNPILDILLSDKGEALKEKEIRFDTKVYNVALDFMEPIDITTIFGNLLDNAVEACMEVRQDKHISIKISSYHQMVSVRIENSCNPVHWKNGQPVPEKRKGRGIGLLNVRRSIEKYDGSMKLKYEDGMFIVELFLNS